MRRLVAFIALALLIGLVFVQAQEATETPLPPTPTSLLPTLTPTPTAVIEGAIVDGDAEILFPQAIRFYLLIDAPAENIRASQLVITPEDGDPVEIDLDLEAVTLSREPDTELLYLWMLSPDNPPAPFTEIAYDWTVTFTDGETARLEDRLLFVDDRVIWSRVSDETFGLAIPLALGNASALQRAMFQVYDLLAFNTGESSTYNLVLYDDVQPGCSVVDEEPVAVGARSGTIIPCDPLLALAIYRQGDYTVLRKQQGMSAGEFLVDYLVQDFYSPRWRGRDVPAWFASGLGLFYAPTRRGDLLSPMRAAARSDTLLPLSAMRQRPNEFDPLWRAQSYGMVLYMAEQIGYEGIFRLANEIAEADSFDEAYREIVGGTPQTLIPLWSQWIFSRDAERAYNITPYQASTATLTPTHTYTPSRTPTATSTSTSTPTPSVTGYLSATPAETVTPSVTPTSAPPTNTPRPPGSLPTSSPTPPPTVVDTLSQPDVRGGILVGLLVILIVLVLAVLRLGRQ